MAPFVLAMVSMVHGRRIRLTPKKIEKFKSNDTGLALAHGEYAQLVVEIDSCDDAWTFNDANTNDAFTLAYEWKRCFRWGTKT